MIGQGTKGAHGLKTQMHEVVGDTWKHQGGADKDKQEKGMS